MSFVLRALALTAGVSGAAGAAGAARPTARAADAVSAPISNIAYDVTFDGATARDRTLDVAMTFTVGGPGDVVLSLPAWTPGDYVILNFARNVFAFSAVAIDDGGQERSLSWDKADYDTWRITPAGARRVRVHFRYIADAFDNAQAWAVSDAVFFNGTNLFLYAEGRPFDAPATVTIHTEPRWQIATGMTRTAPNVYGAATYHDLVDMPFLIGRIDVDSARVVDRWVRFATYPAGAVQGVARRTMWDWIAKSIPPEAKVFGTVPWSNYTVLLVADSASDGWSGLEHQNSHLDLVGWFAIDNLSPTAFTSDLFAHEIFHSWNVKRLRPSDMWPYRYDRAQPTTLLWMSEGITDYYAELALVRGGVLDANEFLAKIAGHIDDVDNLPPVSLEDASLSAWISPKDGTEQIYYGKGALAGFVLDVEIRSATDNHHSLDDVMRDLYLSNYGKGQGFTTEDFWRAVSRAVGGRSFAAFEQHYVHGRDAYPVDSVLALAGLTFGVDSLRRPVLGVTSNQDTAGVVVVAVDPASPAANAGVQVGDLITAIGEISTATSAWRPRFWARYSDADGQPLPITIRRDGQTMTLRGTVRAPVAMVQARLGLDAKASAKAQLVRQGILTGTVTP
jgi:predicted metalloprotease with PDZ domain